MLIPGVTIDLPGALGHFAGYGYARLGHLLNDDAVASPRLDGAMYGRTVDPVGAGTYAHSFRALRGLGFREREVQKALGLLRRESPSLGAAPSFPAVMRNALARLTEPRC